MDTIEELGAKFSVTKIILDEKGKKQIEDLIIEFSNSSFPVYCDRVGIKPPNFYAVLNGTRACTVEFLNKLLLGVNYQISIQTQLIVHPIETGENVHDVDYQGPEGELHSNDVEEPDEYDSF
jgi:hypothetical protein